MTAWDYNGGWGFPAQAELEPGVLNYDAQHVFARGHCHSLARALRELIPDAELRGIYDGNDAVADHVFVELPDGSYLDINGRAETERLFLARLGYGDEIEPVDPDELDYWEDTAQYRPSRTEDALPFAEALLEREGVEILAAA